MTTDIDQILSYSTVNLTPFEIRGVRSGVNNARTTGPVYTGGTYVPADSSVGGVGSFLSDNTVSSFSFDAPYSSLNTSSLRIGDQFVTSANPNFDFRIINIDSTNSFQVDTSSPFPGTLSLSLDLGEREYVAEPDVILNTTTGQADFTSGSIAVTGFGFNDLTGGDFIKYDGYQDFIRIADVYSNTSLDLVSGYPGDTTSGPYTAKRWIIGRTKIQYAKNNFTYDGQAAKWVYDGITESDLTTSTNFLPFAEGIDLAFSRALNVDDPDLMDVAVTNNQTFASKTQYEAFQFALPVVPFPEASTELFINDIKKTMFEDYVLTYTQSPIYEPPPPPDQRFVANVMFLEGVENQTLSTEESQSGQMIMTDAEGEAVIGQFFGSESIYIDGTYQTPFIDYTLEPNTGTLNITETAINEPIVKYVADDFSEYIDYGFSVFLNGKKQQISFPAKPDDDILFQPASGLIKPRDKDHLAPGQVYQVNYMVETTPVSNETKQGVAGETVIEMNQYPVKQDTIFLSKNGTFLQEGVHFLVSYLSGRILLEEAAVDTDIFKLNYTPLSKQVNNLTYENGWYVTVNDSRLTIRTSGSGGLLTGTGTGNELSDLVFTLANLALDVTKVELLRIYNETRDKDYDLTGYTTDGTIITLQKNATNLAVGLASSDIVVCDYKFVQSGTSKNRVEYSPVEINYLNLEEGYQTVYIEGSDLTSLIDAYSIITLGRPDAASESYHTIDAVSYDGYGTRISLVTPIPDDIVNPVISVSDSTTSFLTVPLTADSIVTGSAVVSFSGGNIQNIFRYKTILGVEDDLYQVSGSDYDSEQDITQVILTSEIISDETRTSVLSNIKYSDNPLYFEGDTEIIPAYPAITLNNQPAFLMNNDSDRILSVSASETELTIDGTAFSYENSPTLGDMSSAIDSSNIDALALVSYSSAWQSDKFLSVTDISVYRDSSTMFYVNDALRYQDSDSTVFTDTSNYSLSEDGNVILGTPLQRGDRYNFDYLGREFLGDRQVEYSVRYFSSLPAYSKVSASFQYINLDQFYIQVLSQKDFFERVTIPRMEEQALQLSGSVGQGGTLPSDDGATNDDGGLTGDEYARKDTEIECRVFENIYDFFQGRLEDYGLEMEAALGVSLFNNDGTFSKAEQDGAAKVVSRIFPETDYTNLEPMQVNPLTGYFWGDRARFTKGLNTVTGSNTLWTQQLDTDGYIGSVDSTRRYKILSVNSDVYLTIDGTYEEKTVTGPYTATNNKYPLYDDDGFLGGKIIGSKAQDYNILSGDAFNCTIDGTGKDYTFEFPTGPFLGNFFSDPDGPSIAKFLTGNIDGLTCSYERVLDPETTYGYRNALVMRTTYPANMLEMGDNTTVDKLGFSSDQTAIGNLNPSQHNPEIILNGYERDFIADEQVYINAVIAAGNIPNSKLDRTTVAAITAVNNAATEMSNELAVILEEIPKVEAQITALGDLLNEEDIPGGNNIIAYNRAVQMLADNSAAMNYINSIVPGWEGKGADWKWSLDFTQHTQIVNGTIGVGGVGVEVGYTVPITGQTSFILEAPAGDDRRILDNFIYSTYYSPVIVDNITSIPVEGTWTGWSVPFGYSANNQITFTIDSLDFITLTDTTTVNNLRYVTDSTAVNLLWEVSGDTTQEVYPYTSYPTVGLMKAALNGSSAVDATGNTIYDTTSTVFQYSTTLINTDATLYPALRDSYITYQTISERLLDARDDFIGDRDTTLSNRINYLNTRESQIEGKIDSEGLLLDSADGGDPGDIYVWANNRYNRRQGCYARLKQIEQQIASNESALQINKSFI